MESLTPDLLAEVLRHIPLQQRLRSCARVSTAWRTAAATASSSISCRLRSRACRKTTKTTECRKEKLDREVFEGWLEQHGQHITQLQLRGRGCLQRLPCPQLLELDLSGLRVQPAAAPASSGGNINSSHQQHQQQQAAHSLLHGLTTLTRLRLDTGGCKDPQERLLSDVAGLTGLRHLEWQEFGYIDPKLRPLVQLSTLAHLTHLNLHGCDRHSRLSADSDLQPLSALAGLQELVLGVGREVTAAGMAVLERLQRLTALWLCGHYDEAFYPSSADPPVDWDQLTALKHLQLEGWGGWQPSSLLELTQLECLELVDWAADGAAGIAALLDVLPRLQRLTRLRVWPHVRDGQPFVGEAVPATHHAGLAAGGKLRSLQLWGWPLPASALQQLCATGRLAHLHTLELCGFSDSNGSSSVINADVDSIASSVASGCPQLRHLVFGPLAAQHPSFDSSAIPLTALSLLTALTSLSITADLSYTPDAVSGRTARGMRPFPLTIGNRLTGQQTAQLVAALPGLRALRIDQHVATLELLQLTALTRLERLRVWRDPDLNGHFCHKDPTTQPSWGVVLVNKAQARFFPDVWQQLLLQVCSCCSHPTCQAALQAYDEAALAEEMEVLLRLSG